MNNICKAALDHYGEQHQIGKAIEELGELSVEISRIWIQGHKTPKNIESYCDELADVLIMVQQLREIAKRNGWEDQLEERINYKLARLDRRIKLGSEK